MSQTPHLAESIIDGVATLTMNRPEARNAMSAEMIQGLMEALPSVGNGRKRALCSANRCG